MTAQGGDEGSGGSNADATMTEALTPSWGHYVRSRRELANFRSRLQSVDVHETDSFGRLFRLDGHFMTSEKDEFYYHENLVHVAAVAHEAPRRALVVGGGDGGSAEELLKHPSVTGVTVCEIDEAVIDIARRFFDSVHRGAFHDPRVTLCIEDGFEYLRRTESRYDLIVLDLTDPGPVSAPLYTEAFFRTCASRLTPDGAMTMHVASPVTHPERVREMLARLRQSFHCVRPYLVPIPLYGGMWMLACAANALDPVSLSTREADRRIAERGLTSLQYYNGAMHQAGFALPNFVQALTLP